MLEENFFKWLPLIITLSLQTFGALWWAGGLELRVRTLETKLNHYELLLERIAKVEEALEAVQHPITP